jgi:hypothetical protein
MKVGKTANEWVAPVSELLRMEENGAVCTEAMDSNPDGMETEAMAVSAPAIPSP